MPLTKIAHVIAKLDYIIEWSKQHKSALGYFPALYQRTTIEVERAIDRGYFDQPDLMRELDIRFAEYYLRAFEQYMRRDPYVSSSWLYAFRLAQTSHASVLQHLLLGMNAHINLDLGISVAQLATPETIGDFKHDFYRINRILYSLVDQMQDMIAEVWGVFKWLDVAMGRLDEKVIEWILRFFRNRAWELANRLVHAESKAERHRLIVQQDERVTQYAGKIGYPVAMKFNPLYHAILSKEQQQVRQIIDVLHHADIYTKW